MHHARAASKNTTTRLLQAENLQQLRILNGLIQRPPHPPHGGNRRLF